MLFNVKVEWIVYVKMLMECDGGHEVSLPSSSWSSYNGEITNNIKYHLPTLTLVCFICGRFSRLIEILGESKVSGKRTRY